MKTSILVIAIIASIFSACEQNEKASANKTNQTATNNEANYDGGLKPANRLYPDKLRGLPTEIIAAHYPNPTLAEFEDGMYVWKHNTTISAKENLQIIEYGSFVYTPKGWYLRVTMSPEEFAVTYNCEDAILKKDMVYTDNNSWRRGDTLTAGDAMWFYIAKDKNGRIVKGVAPIETEAKLLENSNGKAVQVTNSAISWTGYGEVGGYSLTGDIKLKNADVRFNNDTLKEANIKIDVSSLNHKDKNLESHLKNEDFFDVTKYPEASFETTEINNTNPVAPIVKGKMTIKGVTKPISIPLAVTTTAAGKKITGKIVLDRTVFGIKYGSKSFFGNLGDQAIKNKFDLNFSVDVK